MLKENQFILGIDIGDATSSLAYFDTKKMAPQLLDISGGYGKTTMATALQYIKETDEWVFGDYALQNQTYDNPVLQRLFSNPTSTEDWTRYIEEFLGNIFSIHPKARLAEIVVCQSGNISDDFKAAFDEYKDITDFVNYSECVFAYHYFSKKPHNEKLLLLDYGSRGLRAELYTTGKTIKQESRMESTEIAISSLDTCLEEYFANILIKKQGVSFLKKEDIANIKNFVQEHKYQIFLKQKSVRLYMNFCFPPITCDIKEVDLKEIIQPFYKNMRRFLESSVSNLGIDISDIDTVLLTGGGFEMSWAKGVVDELFPDSNITKYRGTKALGALGASVIGAKNLGLIPKDILVEGFIQLYHDIGLYVNQVKEKVFAPIIERENFLPGRIYNCSIIVAEDTTKPFTIDLVKRSPTGELSLAYVLSIDPINRPPLTTRLDITIKYADNNFFVKVTDMGFGELFPATGFSREYICPV